MLQFCFFLPFLTTLFLSTLAFLSADFFIRSIWYLKTREKCIFLITYASENWQESSVIGSADEILAFSNVFRYWFHIQAWIKCFISHWTLQSVMTYSPSLKNCLNGHWTYFRCTHLHTDLSSSMIWLAEQQSIYMDRPVLKWKIHVAKQDLSLTNTKIASVQTGIKK